MRDALALGESVGLFGCGRKEGRVREMMREEASIVDFID